MRDLVSSNPAIGIPERPLVSVLFVTYKRIDRLHEALGGFLLNTAYPHLELVVCDDGSPQEIQTQIRSLPFDRFVLNKKNRGLGANNNSGIKECLGKYILMIQDDRFCLGPPDYLSEAVSVMEDNPEVGLLNFCGTALQPRADISLAGGHSSFAAVSSIPRHTMDKEVYLYTDTPHLVRRAAMELVGPYIESRDMEACERDYEVRWQRQTSFLTVQNMLAHDTVFEDAGLAGSFREARFRYKVERFLSGAGNRIKAHFPAAFIVLRACVRFPIRILERTGIIR